MAHTKAKGSTKLGRDSQSKRLGVKIFGGQLVSRGSIIVRQRGTKYHPDKNVKASKDYTLHALTDGTVNFKRKKLPRFTGNLKEKTIVSVEAIKQ